VSWHLLLCLTHVLVGLKIPVDNELLYGQQHSNNPSKLNTIHEFYGQFVVSTGFDPYCYIQYYKYNVSSCVMEFSFVVHLLCLTLSCVIPLHAGISCVPICSRSLLY
jgi:hypothetical protein